MGARIYKKSNGNDSKGDSRIENKCCGNCVFFINYSSFGIPDYHCMNEGRDYHTVLFPEKSGCSKYVKTDLTTKDLEEAQRNIRL